jgi:hypothetical protein
MKKTQNGRPIRRGASEVRGLRLPIEDHEHCVALAREWVTGCMDRTESPETHPLKPSQLT